MDPVDCRFNMRSLQGNVPEKPGRLLEETWPSPLSWELGSGWKQGDWRVRVGD